MKRRVVLGLLLIAFVGASSAVADQPTTRPSSPALVDIDGVVRRPLDLGENRAAVVIFVRTDCPISNQHAPEIRRLADEFGPKRIAFYLAYAARSLPVAEAREHAKQYGLSLPAMIDR